MMATYKFTNQYGDSIIFSKSHPFHIKTIDSQTAVSASVTESSTVSQIGSSETGYKINSKTITVDGDFLSDHGNRKILLDTITAGYCELEMISENQDVFISGYITETPDINRINPLYDSFSFSFLCPFPYWQSTFPKRILFSTTRSEFSYPKTFYKDVPFKISSTERNRILDVVNASPVPIGMKIRFSSLGIVEDPSITNIGTQEKIAFEGLSLYPDEILEVSTKENGIYCTIHRESGDINAFKYLSDDSTFFKINRGSNTIQYDSKTNVDGLNLEIIYEEVFSGV